MVSVAGVVLLALGVAESTCGYDGLPWFGLCPFSRLLSSPSAEDRALQSDWMHVEAELEHLAEGGGAFVAELDDVGPVPLVDPSRETCPPVVLRYAYPDAYRQLGQFGLAPAPSTCVRELRVEAGHGTEVVTYALSCDGDCDGRRNTVEYRFKRVDGRVLRRSLRLERDPWHFYRPSAL